MSIDAIDPRYRRFVVAVEPPLTDQQRRDIINAGKQPPNRLDIIAVKRPLTRLEKQRVAAMNRASKAARRKYDA